MNNAQRAILAIYLPLTGLILLLQALYQQMDAVIYVRYTTMITMFLAAVFVKKRFVEQKLIALALLFVVISDFFFGIVLTMENVAINRNLYGMLSFVLSYVCLILAFHKKFQLGRREIFVAVPLILSFGSVFLMLRQYAQGVMFVAAMVFGIILCFMTWSAISSLFQGYFQPKAARLIVLAAVLLFVGDLGGVAFAMFDPRFAGFVLWNKTLIWMTYVPAWALLLCFVCEENLKIGLGK